tara:strand:+ start:6291 stop:7055 length:765 start_codon:yes stop_codon:yes gene_type:complete
MTPPTLAEPIALIDMDGTLADYDIAMRRDLRVLTAPAEMEELEACRTLHDLEAKPHWKARMDMIKRQVGWWRTLERMEKNFEVVNLMRQMSFDLHILTKGPWRTTSAWSEKVEWCREHTPYASVHISEDKGLVYGKVLFDDFPPYILRWLTWRTRGLVIMPAHPWNEGFTHPNVIRWDNTGAAWDEIQARMWEVRQTALYTEDNAPDFIRASGDAQCPDCSEPYRDHPYDLGFLSGIDNKPYIRVACDGRRLKL